MAFVGEWSERSVKHLCSESSDMEMYTHVMTHFVPRGEYDQLSVIPHSIIEF